MKRVGEDGEILAEKGRKGFHHARSRGFSKTFLSAFEPFGQRLGRAAPALLNPKGAQIAAAVGVEERLTAFEEILLVVEKRSQKALALLFWERRDLVFLQIVDVCEPFFDAVKVREAVFDFRVVEVHHLLGELEEGSIAAVREETLCPILDEQIRHVHGDRMRDGGGHDAVARRAVAHTDLSPQIVAKKQPGSPRFHERLKRVVAAGNLACFGHFSDLLVLSVRRS